MGEAASQDPKWLRPISAVSHALNRIAAFFAAIVVTIMLVSILLEIVLRMFSKSTHMTDVIVANGLSISTFLALAWAMESGSMIRVNLVQQMVSATLRYALELICVISALLVAGWLWYYVFKIFERSFKRGTMATHMISFPKWYLEIFAVIGLGLLFLHIVVRLLRLVFVGYKLERSVEI